ncbi:peptide alpha-N-acetyltransferase Nat2 [Pseudohyphozyma bogoriensis]|nr:peptide alpha-N-acetyltransferase Nat2 [Pseudohyphozyma bogoriensis]
MYATAGANTESGFNRLRTLFRKHGWTALVVYLVLSVIDFGLTFLVIYSVGADRVRDAEDWVLDKLQWRRRDGEDGKIKKAVKDRVETWKENHPKMVKEKSVKEKEVAAAKAAKEEGNVTALAPPPPEPTVNDVQKTLPEDKSGYSALATTAVLAYTIHKIGLLPVRLGLTVWVTPRLVKTLQSWGWRVGMAAPAAGKIKTPRVVTPKPAK